MKMCTPSGIQINGGFLFKAMVFIAKMYYITAQAYELWKEGA
jgi:hypothetical protein